MNKLQRNSFPTERIAKCRVASDKNSFAILRRLLFSFAIVFTIQFTILASFVYSQAPAPPVAPGSVRMNFRGETPLSTLVEYISQRLTIRFIYDDSLANKKINLQVPDEIPVDSLLDLLQSALRINGLVLVQTEQVGWFRIVPNDKIPQVSIPASPNDNFEKMGATTPVTQVFALKRGDPNQIKTLIQPFLTSPGANSIATPANRTLIVTDIAANLGRIRHLIDLLDADQFSSSIRFVKAQHVNAEELSERLQQIMSARARTEANSVSASSGAGEKGTPRSSTTGLEIAVEPRSNQLILIGLPSQIDAAIELLKSLDTPLSTTTQTYRLQFLSPKQFDELLRQWIDTLSPKPTYESRVEGSALVVTATEGMQQQIARLVPQFDSRESSAKQSPIRFYKIENVPVQDILETLNSLQGGFGQSNFPGGGQSNFQGGRSQQRSRTTNDRAIPGPNIPNIVGANNAQPGLIPPNPPAIRNGLVDAGNQNQFAGGSFPFAQGPNQAVAGGQPGLYGFPFNPYGFGGGFQNGYGGGQFGYERGIQSPLGNAQVTADLGSNTLIIIAEPEVQQAYEQLIEFLDKRRPQVMIEARIVIIDTTDDYTLGVELSGGDSTGARRLFAFSSYGLSTVTPATGALALTPGNGFNATLVDPATADVVVRALAAHRRARVLSAPKILVDDNAEGTLTSVNEVPFTSVNASQTVATTSFAGFAEAGTTITVTPTISKAKHVNLDYVVTLNSFTGAGSAGVPPPRQTNEISSRVTVPDGYTIIVGGLTQKNVSNTLNGIPYLENIPLIRELTSLKTSSNRDNSLFVFLRPVILQEDKFRDLLFLSKKSANAACDGQNFPASPTLWMEK